MRLIAALLALHAPSNENVNVKPLDTVGFTTLKLHFYVRNAESVKLRNKALRLGKKVEQCGGEHIAGSAHAAV